MKKSDEYAVRQAQLDKLEKYLQGEGVGYYARDKCAIHFPIVAPDGTTGYVSWRVQTPRWTDADFEDVKYEAENEEET